MSEHKMNLSDFIRALFPEEVDDIENERCPFCHQPIGDFKDELSRKEFKISGMCQRCQDDFFDSEDGEDAAGLPFGDDYPTSSQG